MTVDELRALLAELPGHHSVFAVGEPILTVQPVGLATFDIVTEASDRGWCPICDGGIE